jgi:hypothetical protein
MDYRVIGEYIIPFAGIALILILALGESGIPLVVVAIARLLSGKKEKDKTPHI